MANSTGAKLTLAIDSGTKNSGGIRQATLPAGSKALPAGSKALQTGSEADPAGFEAHPAGFEALAAGSKAFSNVSGTLSASCF